MSLLFLCFVSYLPAGFVFDIPDELEKSYRSLQEATANKNVAQVKKLATETSAMARKVMAEPAPESDLRKEYWKRDVAYATDIQIYAEYALFAVAVQSPPETLIDLIDTLGQLSPKSRYMDDAYARYFVALSQTGAAAKIVPYAQKALDNHPDSEDLLLVLADNALNGQQADKAGEYAERILATLPKEPKPDTLSQDEWDKKKNATLGRAYWIAGLVHAGKNQFEQADEDLRGSLPYLKGNDQLLGSALFQLGVVNYNLGKTAANKQLLLEAAGFSEQAAALPGPQAQQAAANAKAMRAEAAKIGAPKKK
jgi:tetratricopeptide (TPR) repeat protein